jgi:hypothetical protein
METQAVNGAVNGPYKIFNEDGKVDEEGAYKDGKLDGHVSIYLKDGRLFYTEIYRADRVVKRKYAMGFREIFREILKESDSWSDVISQTMDIFNHYISGK